MSNQQPPSQPEVPAELWMLWMPKIREWVVSPCSSGLTYIVAFSEADATAAARQHKLEYNLDFEPVRVK